MSVLNAIATPRRASPPALNSTVRRRPCHSNRVHGIERRAMSAVIDPAVNSITLNARRPVQFMAVFFVAIHTMSDLIERRFAEFAGIPYQSRLSRQQWEEVWKAEAER
jgi:hypothetical protein